MCFNKNLFIDWALPGAEPIFDVNVVAKAKKSSLFLKKKE